MKRKLLTLNPGLFTSGVLRGPHRGGGPPGCMVFMTVAIRRSPLRCDLRLLSGNPLGLLGEPEGFTDSSRRFNSSETSGGPSKKTMHSGGGPPACRRAGHPARRLPRPMAPKRQRTANLHGFCRAARRRPLRPAGRPPLRDGQFGCQSQTRLRSP